MEARKYVRFGLLFAVLAGFTAVSLGMASDQGGLVQAVLASPGDEGNVWVSASEPAFDAKVLDFLKKEKVCALSAEQAAALAANHEVETKEFTVDGSAYKVLYVEGVPMNKNLLEREVGALDPRLCNVVHGNKMVALLTPVFVS